MNVKFGLYAILPLLALPLMAAAQTPTSGTCPDTGASQRVFQDVPNSPSLKASAADITLTTLNGTWNLKDHWSSCESYVFVQDDARQNARFPISLYDRDLDTLLAKSPQNVHYFFFSVKEDISERTAVITNLQTEFTKLLSQLPAAKATLWRDRLHFILDNPKDRSDWLGSQMRDPAWGVAIDRFQKLRFIGSYADPTRWNQAIGWFEPNISYLANEVTYFNFEAQRQTRLAAAPATTIIALANQPIATGWGGKPYTFDVQFPSASEMAKFNHLEIDLATSCGGVGERGHCPAWDRILSLYICDANEVCEQELGRWITTYHREGRWVHDITPLLPLIAQGGQIKFGLTTVDKWHFDLSFRLGKKAENLKPAVAEPLYKGAPFDLDYNDKFATKTVAIPAGTKKVELVYAMTGHGMAGGENCAEFCDAQHFFTVNNKDFEIRNPEAGTLYGCEEDVSNGTIPNQYGTWFYGRANWCPGKEVPLQRIDITEQVALGQSGDVVVNYRGFGPNGKPFDIGDKWAEIVLASWLVFYK